MAFDWNWKKAGINRQNAELLGNAARLAYSDTQAIANTLKS